MVTSLVAPTYKLAITWSRKEGSDHYASVYRNDKMVLIKDNTYETTQQLAMYVFELLQ